MESGWRLMRATLVVGILVGGFLALSCQERADTPEAAVKQFFEALSRGDQDALLDSLCPTNRGDFGGLEFVLNYFGLTTPPIGYRNLEMTTTMESEDRAVVNTSASLRLLFIEQPFDLPLTTMKEGGRWYVCDESTPFQQPADQFRRETNMMKGVG
jgi:hypothetical protein